MVETTDQNRVKLPGFGLPLNEMPKWTGPGDKSRFPHAISDNLATHGVTVREQRMLAFILEISDKPDWERKVFDETIVAKWRQEAETMQGNFDGDIYMSSKMFDYCIAELQDKAKYSLATGLMQVLDVDATIVKSDTAVGDDLRKRLREAAAVLEDVPEVERDWHPYSGDLVLDLVHPSLYPVVYGVTKALPYGTVSLDNCLQMCGHGETVTLEGDAPAEYDRLTDAEFGNKESLPAWGKYQWLPADVHFTREGGATIASYIPSLHPSQHKEIYATLEAFVDRAIPLWSDVLSYFHNRSRITVKGTSDEDYEMPEGLKFSRYRDEDDDPEGPELITEDDSDFDEWADDAYQDWKREHRILQWPEPDEFKSFAERMASKPKGANLVDLRKDYEAQGLQVIFKMANIHLNPENPRYEGGSWHVEGALNEHICATALYYYDQDNVTDSSLAFQQALDNWTFMMRPAQSEFSSLEAYFGIEQDGPCIQDLGSIKTLPGRLLAFPNVLQHRVGPFELIDKTKPGHRKILAMFLVDPHIRVLSTANVPPQRLDWWATGLRQMPWFARLPGEIFDMIVHAVGETRDFPISRDAAMEYRESLMEERGLLHILLDEALKNVTFNFCEH